MSKIHALRWDFCTREMEDLIKREFSVSITYPKGGVVWTCVKDNIIKEKQQYDAIGIRGFDYKLFEEYEGVGGREGLDGYPYFKHMIQLCLGDWVKQMANINLVVRENNCIDNYEGRNIQFFLLEGKSYGSVLGEFYRQLSIGRKDTRSKG